MSILKVAVASVLALSLVLGLALPALADSGEPLPWTEDFQARIVKGEVTYVDEADQEYFEVQSGEDEISIRVDENTKYFMLNAPGRIVPMLERFRLRNQVEVETPDEPGLKFRLQNQIYQTEDVPLAEPQQARLRVQNQVAQTEDVSLGLKLGQRFPFGGEAEFGDIEVGDRVVVWLAEGESLAKWVLIVKPTVRAHVSGTITDVSSSTIEITTDDGEEVTLRYNQDTVFILNGFTSVEEGQLARAVYDRESKLAQRIIVYLPD